LQIIVHKILLFIIIMFDKKNILLFNWQKKISNASATNTNWSKFRTENTAVSVLVQICFGSNQKKLEPVLQKLYPSIGLWRRSPQPDCLLAFFFFNFDNFWTAIFFSLLLSNWLNLISKLSHNHNLDLGFQGWSQIMYWGERILDDII